MSVRAFVWAVRDAWLASCPTLGIGVRSDSRHQALHLMRREVRGELEMVFNSDIRLVDGAPPAPVEEDVA